MTQKVDILDLQIKSKLSMLLILKLCLFAQHANIKITKRLNLHNKSMILTTWFSNRFKAKRCMLFLESELYLSFIFKP